MTKTTFEKDLEDEINKVRGIYYPVKAGILRRLFIKQAACDKLHPNPNDEFCVPEIGPNYEIISNYERDYAAVKGDMGNISFMNSSIREPIMVEKTRPDGYMILNGHHRWAAARKVGIRKLKISIVDLTQEKDIRKMLKATQSDKRVALDLDEVVFCSADDPCREKRLSFPQNLFYKEQIRLGIPSLFHSLSEDGYDIWVYSAKYYSLDHIKRLFRCYRVPVTGIVTGIARKGPPGSDTMTELEKLMDTKYQNTVHIDNHMILCTSKGTKEYEDYPLSGSAETWSREVKEILSKQK